MSVNAKPWFELTAVTLRRGDKKLCSSLNCTILPGQVWGLLGSNGAGKSTLLQVMAGLQPSQAGAVSFQGKPIEDWPRRALAGQLGVLLQDQHYSFPAKVRELVMQGRHPYQSLWQADSALDNALVDAALEQVDLLNLAHRSVDSLSGGERQRLAIASLLAQQTPMLLLDEPSNHLDLHYQVRLLETLVNHSQTLGGAILASLHDLNLAARFCTHLILMLGDGEVALGTRDQMLNEDYLHRLYRHCIIKIEAGNGCAFLPG